MLTPRGPARRQARLVRREPESGWQRGTRQTASFPSEGPPLQLPPVSLGHPAEAHLSPPCPLTAQPSPGATSSHRSSASRPRPPPRRHQLAPGSVSRVWNVIQPVQPPSFPEPPLETLISPPTASRALRPLRVRGLLPAGAQFCMGPWPLQVTPGFQPLVPRSRKEEGQTEQGSRALPGNCGRCGLPTRSWGPRR